MQKLYTQKSLTEKRCSSMQMYLQGEKGYYSIKIQGSGQEIWIDSANIWMPSFRWIFVPISSDSAETR